MLTSNIKFKNFDISKKSIKEILIKRDGLKKLNY